MIWEIVQMVSGLLFGGGVAALVILGVALMTSLESSYSTIEQQRFWLMPFIIAVLFTVSTWVAFSVSTVRIAYLEQGQTVISVRIYKCSECGEVLEAHEDTGVIIIKPCENCRTARGEKD